MVSRSTVSLGYLQWCICEPTSLMRLLLPLVHVRTVVAGRRGRDPVARPCRGISSGEVSFRDPALAVDCAAAQVDGPELFYIKLLGR